MPKRRDAIIESCLNGSDVRAYDPEAPGGGGGGGGGRAACFAIASICEKSRRALGADALRS